VKLVHGDSLVKLKDLPDCSIDAIVTDPPYGLSFMGKKWDYDVPSEELWREVFRVMKPGAHLLSFFGTRTYHAGVTRIEAAGFEVRDMRIKVCPYLSTW
jgi:DNA modification methylase